MTDQEVQPFLAYPAIIVLLAWPLGMAAKRLGQSPVLGEIIDGIGCRRRQRRRSPDSPDGTREPVTIRTSASRIWAAAES